MNYELLPSFQSPYHPITLLLVSLSPVTPSPHHPLTPSPCHPLTPSPCHLEQTPLHSRNIGALPAHEPLRDQHHRHRDRDHDHRGGVDLREILAEPDAAQ